MWHFWSSKSIDSSNSSDLKVNVTAIKVAQQALPITLSAIGSLSAKQSITVSPEIAGQIELVLCELLAPKEASFQY